MVSNNAGTVEQIRRFLDEAYRKAKNPNAREMMLKKIKSKRKEKAQKVSSKYGL